MDPDRDFVELWSRFDILLMGRKTYEMARKGFEQFGTQGSEIVVASPGASLRRLSSRGYPFVNRRLRVSHEFDQRPAG
jgi:hypothetical protein